MAIEIIDKTSHPKGTLYIVKINGHLINILFLFHAIERMKKWSISGKIVIETMLQPEEVLLGHRRSSSLMETVEYFYDFLNKIGAPNFLAVGIALIVLWLLISGIRKGLKGGRRDDGPDQEGED